MAGEATDLIAQRLRVRLNDIPVFAPLVEIADKLGIALTLMGGAASRSAVYLALRQGQSFDLFDLAPFSSDIDLEHSGDAEKTGLLLREIQRTIPFASWMRWSINDAQRAEKAAKRRVTSTLAPLRQFRFSTTEQCTPTEKQVYDLATRTVSFARNIEFTGIVDGERVDAEIYGLMMALNMRSDLRGIVGAGEIDETAAIAWIRDSYTELSAVAARPRVTARFWHLIATQIAQTGHSDPLVRELLRMSDEAKILENLGVELLDEPRERALTISRLTSTGGFRAAQTEPDVVTGADASMALDRALRDLAGAWRDRFGEPIELPDNALDLIDPAFELVAVVPHLTIEPFSSSGGREELDDDDPFLSGMEQEFVQIAWLQPSGGKLNPLGLTAQLVPSDPRRLNDMTSAVPAVGGTFGDGRAWVRLRLDDIVDYGRSVSDNVVAVAILQARHG